MKILCLYWNDTETITHITNMLHHNKIVLGSSDTIIGLLAPLTSTGFEKLNKIKGRSDKPYIVLIGDHKKISLFAEMPLHGTAKQLINCCWPGPLTLIVKARQELPFFLKGRQETVAVRMPNHQGLLTLLEQFDGLFSTSANKTDKPIPHSFDEVDPQVIEQTICCVLDSPEKEKFFWGQPSTILDCTKPQIHVIREGAYPIAELESLCGQFFKQ